MCPPATDLLGPNKLRDVSGTDVYRFGDNVTITCEENYAFTFNYTAEGSDRVQTSKEAVCEDVPGSTTANWTTVGTCQGTALGFRITCIDKTLQICSNIVWYCAFSLIRSNAIVFRYY